MVFQDPLLFDTTVFENVASGLRIRGMKKEEIDQGVSENMERFGISHLLQRSARKISGGEAQRVALARAFATQPEILFLDEPFASLDPPTRESLLTDLEETAADRNDNADGHSRPHGSAAVLRPDCRDEPGEDLPDRIPL